MLEGEGPVAESKPGEFQVRVSDRRGKRWPRVAVFVLLLLLLSIGPAACSVVIDQRSAPIAATGTNEVPLTIVAGPGGSVLALVPVYINGKGPYGFALDTGASMSVVDSGIARQLNLPDVGSAGEATGVGGMVEARLVRVDTWRVGNVNLSSNTLSTINLPGANTERGLQGLLGSDVLSDFDVITVDYDRRVLILGPHVSPQPSPS